MAKGFQKGAPRPAAAGRKKGTPNKVTGDLIQTLREMNFDPAAQAIILYREAIANYKAARKNRRGFGGGSYLATAQSALAQIMRYTYPTRKAIEGPDGQPITFAAMISILDDDNEDDDDNADNE